MSEPYRAPILLERGAGGFEFGDSSVYVHARRYHMRAAGGRLAAEVERATLRSRWIDQSKRRVGDAQ